MLPTLSVVEWVLEEKIRHEIFPQTLKRGDLVTLISPLSASQLVCKRIIGLPGDVVLVDPTTLVPTSYQSGGPYETAHVLVPPGHVWVQGDNAGNSRDSRNYGPVPIALIRGRFICSFGTVPSYTGIKWHNSDSFVTPFPTPHEG
jgi:mitochondrial inner membrane protease subunit 1